MKYYKWISFLLLFSFILAHSICAQSKGTAAANVRVSLVKALQVNKIQGDLSFGELILTGVAAKVERSPEKGVLFEINGHPGRNITLDFDKTILNANASNKNLQFIPKINHTSNHAQYVNPTTVTKGSSYKLEDKNGNGYLYIWVGGEIDIDGNLPSGDYSGEFLVTVSY